MNKITNHAKKIGTGILGGVVLLVGLVTIPYPGPGWLIVFAGLAILATEFQWAQHALDRARGKYDQWQMWLRGRKAGVRILFFVLTCVVVIVTIWLMNGYGLINSWFNLGWDWTRSPIPFFR